MIARPEPAAVLQEAGGLVSPRGNKVGCWHGMVAGMDGPQAKAPGYRPLAGMMSARPSCNRQ